ncbi:MAG: hypothetical protein PHW62_03470 [Candidatus Ratteibacteria bacterium]|nr:hypothetical protein [Candidatus Ratteibacteria bacterium]
MIEVQFNTAKLEKAIRMVPNVLRYELENPRGAWDHIGKSFFKKFFNERLKGPPGIKSFSIYRLFKYRVIKSSSNIMDSGIEMYTPSAIARIHETGATLTSEKGIPIPFSQKIRPEMYTARGQLRKKFKDIEDIKNLRRVRLRTGYFWAQFKRKNPSEIKPMYTIRNTIILKKRLGFYDTWRAHIPRQIEILNRAVSNTLKRI